jgi:hypothetical protein
MAASDETFAPMFECQKRSLASESIRYDQWRLTSAQLNQDPSLVFHYDFENLSESDWALRNAAEKHRSMLDATIVGCQRAQGRWREKQALEFQIVNDRQGTGMHAAARTQPHSSFAFSAGRSMDLSCSAAPWMTLKFVRFTPTANPMCSHLRYEYPVPISEMDRVSTAGCLFSSEGYR